MTYRFYGRGIGIDLAIPGGADVSKGMVMAQQAQAMAQNMPSANALVGAAQQQLQTQLVNQGRELAKGILPEGASDEASAVLNVIIKNGENFVNDVAAGKNVEASFRAALAAGAAEGMVVGATIAGAAVCTVFVVTAPLAPLCALGSGALTQAMPLSQMVMPAVNTVMDTIHNVDIGFKDLDKGNIGGALEMFGQSFFDSVDNVIRAFTGPDWDKYHADSVNQYWAMAARLQSGADVVARTERIAIVGLQEYYNKGIQHLIDNDRGGVLAAKYGFRYMSFDEAKQLFESFYSGTIGKTNYHGVTKVIGWNKFTYEGDNFTASRLADNRKILPMYCTCGDRIPQDQSNPNPCCHVPMNMIPTVFPNLGTFDTNFAKRFDGTWWPEGWAPGGRPFDGDTYAYLWGVCGRHLLGSMTKWSGVAQWYLFDLVARQAQIAPTYVAAMTAATERLLAFGEHIGASSAYSETAYSALTAYRAKSAYSSKIALQTNAFLAAQKAAATTSSTTTWLMLGAVGAGLAWYFWPKKH